MYGPQQRPNNWSGTIDHHLAKIGFGPLKSDPCIYLSEDDTGFAIHSIYVDDVLLLVGNEQLLNNIKKQFLDRSEMTDMDNVSRVLGMNAIRDR